MSEIEASPNGDYDEGLDIEAYQASIRAVLPHLYGDGSIETQQSSPNGLSPDTVAQLALKLAKDKKL